MQWLALTILAICSRASYSIGTKTLSNVIKLDSIVQSVLLTSGATLLAILISPLVGGVSFARVGEHWPIVLAMILTQTIGNVLFFKGQAKLEASTTQVTFSSIILWSAAFSAAFLGSRFSDHQLLGIGVLLIAILAVQYRKNMKTVEPAALYILAAAALFALFQVTSAELAKYLTAGTYLVLAYGGASLLIAIAYARKLRRELPKLAKGLRPAALAVLFASGTSLLYFTFSYFAYRVAPDRGVVVVLLTSQVVLSVLLGIIVLKERSNIGRKLAAGILAVAAGVLIKS